MPCKPLVILTGQCTSIYPVCIFFHIHCDKSVNKERRTGDKDEEQGTRPGNEARETLRPYPNSETGTGNEDPPCVDMGGMSDPTSRCIIIGN